MHTRIWFLDHVSAVYITHPGCRQLDFLGARWRRSYELDFFASQSNFHNGVFVNHAFQFIGNHGLSVPPHNTTTPNHYAVTSQLEDQFPSHTLGPGTTYDVGLFPINKISKFQPQDPVRSGQVRSGHHLHLLNAIPGSLAV